MAHIAVLSDDEIKASLSFQAAIENQRAAFLSLHHGEVEIPERTIVKTSQGAVLFKPFVSDQIFGLKVVAAYSSGTPAVILLMDTATGLPKAVLSATYLTALRTAAGSAVAADLLAVKDDNISATIFGAGLQAELHLLCLRVVRPNIKRFFIVNRTLDKAKALAERMGDDAFAVAREEANACVAKSKVIVTATASREPLFDGSCLLAGTFIAAVGSYTLAMRELDDATVRKSKIIADNPDEAYRTSGDLNNVVKREAVLMSLGDLLENRESALRSFDIELDVKLFKSIGTAVQDLFIAKAALKAVE